MIKKRRGSAKAALGRQKAEIRRNARGKRFVGEDTGAEAARAAERTKVIQMQAAARMASDRAREAELHRHEATPFGTARSRIRVVGKLVRDTTRLAGTIAGLPLRMASAAASIPVRLATAIWLRPHEA